jgi:iron complex transport system substrate-binding protein
MVVDGKTYKPVNAEGNSEFIIPIRLDKEMAVQADTTAMSTPHLIDYTLVFSLDNTGEDDANTDSTGNMKEANASKENAEGVDHISTSKEMAPPSISGLTYVSTDENAYAGCYRVHRYDGDVTIIVVDDGRMYLVIPEGMEEPGNLPVDITVIRKPVSNVYLAASGVMCHFDSLDAVNSISLSGTDRDNWYIDSAIEAMDQGTLIYGGKYSAPDYEMMVDKEIHLAIENTMILHSPKVLERLEDLGIPVFIDRSSYENEPLGRLEWIKIYGILTGKEKQAGNFFDQQKSLVEAIDTGNLQEKKVAVFAVNSNHQIVTRKSNDYLAKMITEAGGIYLSPEETDSDSSSTQMTISIEAFYAYALDADILIYNGTIQDAPQTLDELLAIDKLFGSLSAVQNGKVWYTDKSLYQFANKTGTIIENLNAVISREEKETLFFHGLN